ncbi:protein kinase domain-containing protein [Frankia tisae]|uniref:protein kinase domain-containing protein n=1 Tax=Frankia tisae TaxID=2950104 RepID=UPI0021C094A1|nr:protein kinase [Frankia tisae]
MLTPLQAADPRQIGPYQVRQRIGSGGMGIVYLAFGPDGQPVALKVPRMLQKDGFRVRFRVEVEAASRVRGRFVAAVVAADVDAEQPWYAAEYVEGASLASAVATHGPLAGRMLDSLASGLAEALVAIHAGGVVHRDIKPANIILAWDGPKVIDFGIARSVDTTNHTRTGAVLGSGLWMAPEQVRGERAGSATDVFAWGACVVFAASGRPPFDSESIEAVAVRILRTEPDLVGVPEHLAQIVGWALEKDPAARPTATDIAFWLAESGITSGGADDVATSVPAPGDRGGNGGGASVVDGYTGGDVGTGGGAGTGGGGAGRQPGSAVPRGRRRAVPVVAVGAACLLLLLAAVAWAVLPTGRPGLTGARAQAGVTARAPAGSTTGSVGPPATSPGQGGTTAVTGHERGGAGQVTATGTARSTCGIRSMWDAETFVQGEGMQVSEFRGYDQGRSLNVVLGMLQEPAGTNIVRAFFFVGECFIGYDATEPSSDVTLVRAANDVNKQVVLRYALYAPGDSFCCPSGKSTDVTFTLTGNPPAVTNDGTLPSAGQTAPLSRRWHGRSA